MLRKVIQRLLGRGDEGEVDLSGVKRDRLRTHPSDNRDDERRAANEAFDDGIRHVPPSGPSDGRNARSQLRRSEA